MVNKSLLDNMCESVSLVDNKNNILNRYLPYTEELNGVIMPH